ncbi:MAG: dihydrodipicolinate synthase family protein [Clostridia bacterium]|nr:dihydrodipicolinate synthase family protein [Clostridia bacterium]
MSNKAPWEGPIYAVVTPFNERGEIQFEDLRQLLEIGLNDHAGAVAFCGHNGENWSISRKERIEIAKTVVDQVNGRVPVICGVGGSSPVEKIEVCKEVTDCGVDGVMLEPPYVVATATSDEIYEHYEQIASAIDLPILLYNNPRRTQINMTPAIVNRLCQIDKVKGLKESTRDFGQLSETLQLCGDKINVLVGPASMIYPGVLMGAKGFVSSGPLEFMGKGGYELYKASCERDHETAKALQIKANILYKTLFGLGTWPAALKAGLNLLGKPAGVPRKPVKPLNEKETAMLAERMREVGLL